MSLTPHRLAARIFNRPLLITPDKARTILSVLGPRLNVGRLVELGPDGEPVVHDASAMERFAALGRDCGPASRKPFELVDGIAIIPIEGTLVAKTGTLEPYSGMTGYDGLTVKISAAADDPEARAIMLDIDSGGGEVSGCFDLVDLIHAARAKKPVWSVLTEEAYSAAYAIASAADRILVPRTGGTGSIGVVCLHADFSAALEEAGITVTLIHSGSHKVDGNPYQALPDDVRATIQADIDAVRELFAATVARNRTAAGHGLTTKAVLATEAAIFPGAAGVEAGLADAVMAPRDAFAALVAELTRPAGAIPGAARAARSTARRSEMLRGRVYGGTGLKTVTAAAAALAAGAQLAEGEDGTADPPAAAEEPGDEDEEEDDEEMSAELRSFAAKHPAQARALQRLGAASERRRIVGLEALAEPGEDRLLAKLKADGASIETAALTFAESRRKRRAAALAGRQADAAHPVPAAPVDAAAAAAPAVDAAAPIEERAKAEWDRDAKLKTEFVGGFEAYLAYRKAAESGRAKILGARR